MRIQLLVDEAIGAMSGGQRDKNVIGGSDVSAGWCACVHVASATGMLHANAAMAEVARWPRGSTVTAYDDHCSSSR
jgi:hypothetical protein